MHPSAPDIAQYIAMARQAGALHGVPPELLVGQIHQESGFNPDAVSPAGAVGISQFMPPTAKQYGIDPRDPAQSIDTQAQVMRSLYNRFGSWRGALQAYDWGEGNYDSYLKTGRGAKGQAMPTETQQYPDAVLAHARDHAGGQLPPALQVAALRPGAGPGAGTGGSTAADLMGSPSGDNADLMGSRSPGVPSTLLDTPQGPHLAVPSTQEEHDLMQGIASRGYAPGVERQIVGALAQLLPARDALDGRDLLGDGGLPSELDPLIRDIVEKA